MKNINLIPTDKPSRLYSYKNNLFLTTEIHLHSPSMEYQHIYITSEEEIKEGDWCYQVELNDGKVDKCYDVTLYHTWTNNGVDKTRKFKKIILTTDQDLDGVQTIDDEFLEWFVQNPSCEEVNVVGDDCYYEIIIPKEEPKQIKCYCGHTTYCDCSPLEEPKDVVLGSKTSLDAQMLDRFEPKQETLEEDLLDTAIQVVGSNNVTTIREFLVKHKWQQERSYSEEEVKHIVSEALQSALVGYDLEQWFTQFKKK